MPNSHESAAVKICGIAVVICATAVSVGSALAQTQLDQNERASHTLSIANHNLEVALQNYRKRLHGPQRALFDQSQVAWEAYRRAACDFESSGVSGGSAQPLVNSGCLESLTNERLRYIEHLAKCEEGDLNCPAWNEGI
jgi:uncharacterized protein YecT (DUF1311 family)